MLHNPIKKARAWRAKRILAAYGYNFPGNITPNDIAIVGFPKSGNTWMQSIISGLVFGVDGSAATDKLIHDLVPDLHQLNRPWKRYATSQPFKSHHLPRPDFKRVIYIVRDGRDVLSSFYHHCKNMDGSASFEKLLNDQNPVYSNWPNHVERWMENPFGADMLIVRYEDLIDTPIIEMEKIANHLGLALSKGRIRDVATWTTFNKLQERERKTGMSNPRWPESASFFRKGKRGTYKDELPPDILQEFERRYWSTLGRFHYVA